MAVFEINIDIRPFKEDLLKIGRDADKAIKEAALFAAEFIISRAQRNAPKGFTSPGLASSDFVNRPKKMGTKTVVTYGFNRPYASVMDVGFRKKIIRPVRAKALFIPISRRAHRQGPSRGRIRRFIRGLTRGALVYGEDFILAQEVRTPKAVRGSAKGPNFYFTSANEQAIKGRVIEKSIARSIDRLLRKRGK